MARKLTKASENKSANLLTFCFLFQEALSGMIIKNVVPRLLFKIAFFVMPPYGVLTFI